MSAHELSPDPAAVRMQLLEVLGGFLRTQALHTVARLGVADLVGEEPVRVEELAAGVAADPSALHRVMRLLASLGIFSEAEPGAFVATPSRTGSEKTIPRRSATWQCSRARPPTSLREGSRP